jgi:uncharacterized protein YwgA
MSLDTDRIAVITWLAENTDGMGRTALMKYCYFLQVVLGVPLGYNFTLYSYGPFDKEVLSDLDTTEALGGVESTVEYYSGGYGYKIEPSARAERVKKLGEDFIRDNEEQLKWVIREFGDWDSSGLEVASTLIYSDREALRKKEKLDIPRLSTRVRELKPRYGQSQIEKYAERLMEKRLLKSIQ